MEYAPTSCSQREQRKDQTVGGIEDSSLGWNGSFNKKGGDASKMRKRGSQSYSKDEVTMGEQHPSIKSSWGDGRKV